MYQKDYIMKMIEQLS